MSMIIPADSPHGKEMWRWEHTVDQVHPTDRTIHGMSNPSPYPAMMYKVTGKNMVGPDGRLQPWLFEKLIAADEVEQRNLESRGFVAGGPGEAANAYDGQVQAAAVAAAERNYADRGLSEQAKAESNAVEQSSSRHLGEIPRTPIRRRGPNKPKAVLHP